MKRRVPPVKNPGSLALTWSLSLALVFFPASGWGAEKILIKLGHVAPTNNPYHLGAAEFAKKVAKATNGTVEVQIFPNAQLGQERDLAEGLQLGTIQMAIAANAPLTRYVPEALLFDLPFLFRDDPHWEHVVDGPIGKKMKELFTSKGIRILGYWDGGWRTPYARRPINDLQDMRGLKFRTMESPLHISIYNTLGARGVPMGSSETYPALQQGVVDGGDSPPVWYEQLKHYEVAKYLTDLPLFKLTVELLISEKFYHSLSPEVQRAIQKAADETAPYERKVQRDTDVHIIADLQKKGVQFHKVSAAEREKFVQAMSSVWKQYEDKVGKDMIQAVLQAK